MAAATFTATSGNPTRPVVATITATLSSQNLTTNVFVHSGHSITNVNPLAVPSGVYRISLNGTGFTRNSQVSVDGSLLPTTFVSDTRLMATGYATESHAASLAISDGAATSAPVEIQIGVAQPRLTYSAASRFLQQATFGPEPDSIMHLQQIGIQGWLDE